MISGIVNDLRGGVDGWNFTNYVLVMLLCRYISENLTNYINAVEVELDTFDYAKLSDDDAESAREDTEQNKGFFLKENNTIYHNFSRQSKNRIELSQCLISLIS